jgi:hypothetical protein
MIATEMKRTYNSPKLECVKLDNEISLVLQSAPPAGPGESIRFVNNTPDFLNNDPFKTNIG